MDVQASVTRFHEATLIPIGTDGPQPLSLDRLKLRLNLFDEFFELLEASGVPKAECGWMRDTLSSFTSRLTEENEESQDIVEMADALGDIVVVAFGMAIEMGVDLNRVLTEIMRANMSKLDENGRPLLNVCVDETCRQMNRHCPADYPPCTIPEHLVKHDDPHGKVLKASGYTPPNIASVLESQEPLMNPSD